MRYPSIRLISKLHGRIIAATGGLTGVRDRNALDSALAQPRMTFGGEELYPTLAEKAAALGFSLIKNHPFLDGNKRIGFSAMDFFLRLNGSKISGPVDELESVILQLAAGGLGREEFTEWVRGHIIERGDGSTPRVPEVGNDPDTSV